MREDFEVFSGDYLREQKAEICPYRARSEKVRLVFTCRTKPPNRRIQLVRLAGLAYPPYRFQWLQPRSVTHPLHLNPHQPTVRPVASNAMTDPRGRTKKPRHNLLDRGDSHQLAPLRGAFL